MAKKKEKKDLVKEYLSLPAIKDYAKIGELEDKVLFKEFHALNDRDNKQFQEHFLTKEIGDLQAKVHDIMGENPHFAHVEDEKDRKKEIEKFADKLMDHAISKHYKHEGWSDDKIKGLLENINSDPDMRQMWENKVFSTFSQKYQMNGRDAFVQHIMDNYSKGDSENLRDILANPRVMEDLYAPVLDYIDIVSQRKNRLHQTLMTKERRKGLKLHAESKFGYTFKEDVDSRDILQGMIHGKTQGYDSHSLLHHLYEKFEDIPKKYKKLKKGE